MEQDRTRVSVPDEVGVLEGQRRLPPVTVTAGSGRTQVKPARLGSSDSSVVLLGERPVPSGLDHIAVNSVAASRAATAHLVAHGRRRIAAVGREREASRRGGGPVRS